MVEAGQKPTTASETVFREEDDDALLFTPSTGAVQVLNHTGRLVWTLCDGTRTVDQIACAVSEQYGAPIDQVTTDVTAFVTSLRELQMVQLR